MNHCPDFSLWMIAGLLKIRKSIQNVTNLGFFIGVVNEARVLAPVAAADQSHHQRGHGFYLFGRRN